MALRYASGLVKGFLFNPRTTAFACPAMAQNVTRNMSDGSKPDYTFRQVSHG